jgi:homogentisate 1,2-dioxygenase
MAASERAYLSGFGNEFSSEAAPGALPKDQNAPQKPPFGLYVEELNGTAFTAPRGVSRSDWTYRIRPSATHKPFRPAQRRPRPQRPVQRGAADAQSARWKPIPVPTAPTDFVDGIVTLGGNGDPLQQSGAAVHMFAPTRRCATASSTTRTASW